MNYKIQPIEQIVDCGGGYGAIGADVIETKTDQVIASSLPMSQAKAMVRHLNFGGGFDGFTPSFFIEKIKQID